jgi:twitching motility protein PilJ
LLSVDNEIGNLGESVQEMVEQLKGMVQTEADINRMQGQIMNMLSTVSAAADGNLTVEAEVTADALGSLADAFNMMVASLASLVAQVRGSATDMSAATNEIMVSSAQMIKNAEEQQNHITNITSAVDEIAVSMQQVANNAGAATRASQKATEAAQKGEDSVEETIRGMHRIRNTVQVTSKKIKSLGDRSIEIGEIITTIDDIARQTTILALNAAIEAARAGEHGRGFGVVAEEVRKLAERSSKATQDIADLIKGIQAETNEAVRTMEEGTREVEEGTRLADVAGSSLKEIDKSVGQVANLIQEISLAAKQQARGTDGVVRSMETISDITNLHADGVRKTTETITRLATLSDRLTEAIGNFKLADTDVRIEIPSRPPLPAQPQPQPQPQHSPPPAPMAAEPEQPPYAEEEPMQAAPSAPPSPGSSAASRSPKAPTKRLR